MSKIYQPLDLDALAVCERADRKPLPVEEMRDYPARRTLRRGPLTQEWIIDNCELDTKTGCWLWKRAICRNGRGVARVGTRSSVTVARIVWALWTGNDPGNMAICHKCDTLRCCNPDHLFIGTDFDNQQDCISKSRWWSEKRLKRIKVRDPHILALVLNAEGRHRDIALQYGLSPASVWRIKTGNYCPAFRK